MGKRRVIIFCLIFYFVASCKKELYQWNLVSAPSISTVTVEENTLNSFSISSNCISDGNSSETTSGFYWSTHINPSSSDSVVELLKGEGKISKQFNWSKFPIIYVRAFSKNSLTTSLSPVKAIEWSGNTSNKQTLSISKLIPNSFSSIEVTGSIDNTQDYAIQEAGFCISNSSIPTIENAIRVIKSEVLYNQISNEIISELNDNQTYYISFYTISIVGVSYSTPKSFKIPKLYQVGDLGPGGGYVFYQQPSFSSEWNFLEVANDDVQGTYQWGLNSNKTGIILKNVGDGYTNTSLMLSFFDNSAYYSAFMATHRIYNNYSDWYLPSLEELVLIRDLFLKKPNLNLVNAIYWSSTEDENFTDKAWVVKMVPDNINTSKIFTVSKSLNELVRSIRRF